MEQFIELFGDVTIEQLAFFISAMFFLFGIVKVIWKFISNKITQENEKAAEWKKIAEQVQQYPKWRDQSIQIRDELGNAINEVNKKIDLTNKTLSDIELRRERDRATTCRYRILRFNDELLENRLHTKEHFDQILDDIDAYEDYCKKDPDYKNSKAVMAIEHVREVYHKCIDTGKFL